MTKNSTTNKPVLKLTLLSLTIAAAALVLSSALWVKADQLSRQQLNTNLVNAYKNNYTQAQIENLRHCVQKGELECPDDKYVNSSNWKKQIDPLLNDPLLR